MATTSVQTARHTRPSFSRMAPHALAAAALAGALALPVPALAGRCEDLARPAAFDRDTAMEAIFCDYDRAHHGTLLPLSATKGWRIHRAEQLLTPHLATTYVEGGVRKGVLVVQRQDLNNGEVEDRLAVEVDLSVYVFRLDGARWVFEKGNKSAVRTGRHGFAQPARLVRLGPDAFGLVFPGASGNRGYWFFRAAVVALSAGSVREVGRFDMGQDNSGACGAVGEMTLDTCYASRGTLELLDDGAAGHWLLRHRLSGTEATDPRGPATPKESAACHRLGASGYSVVQVEGCAGFEAVREQVSYVDGDLKVEELPRPSSPREQQ